MLLEDQFSKTYISKTAIVPALRPHPSSQADNFGNVVLLALRNPLTAFPAYHQSKAEMYHGQIGQVEEGEWIQFRDQYVGNDTDSHLFNEWKNFIMEWRDMTPYHVGGYLPYEHWIDEAKGPVLVRKLSRILESEGFPILYNNTDEASDVGSDLECLWHKHILAPTLEDDKKRVGWYVPKFTIEQKDAMVDGLNQFASEIEKAQENNNMTRPGDKNLIAILREYIEIIRQTS